METQMLIEFRVKNFLSFRDEQVLSLIASNDTLLKGNCFDAGKHRLLKAAAIYGPNASGKSNLIKAVRFMQGLVGDSGEIQPGRPVNVVPFLLDATSNREPSFFEATFLVKRVRYQYGFIVTRERVNEEWLIAYPRGKPQRWFERGFDEKEQEPTWKWGPSLKGEKSRLAALTRPNALFVSIAAKFNHEQLTPIYKWFNKYLKVLPPKSLMRPVTASMLTLPDLDEEDRQSLKDFVRGFLQDADLGITGFDIKKREIPDADLPKEMPEEEKRQLLHIFAENPVYDVRMTHQNPETEKDIAFDIEDESDGTQRLFELAGPWIESVIRGYTVFVDELESSLHPLLTRKLIKFFQNPDVNEKGAQVIFATHDTTLLDPELFRRDQIWFTEKDKKEASQLYSMYDYKEHKARKGEAMQKGYLAGRYGAIPIPGRFDLK